VLHNSGRRKLPWFSWGFQPQWIQCPDLGS